MRRDDGATGARHWCPLCGRVDRTDEDGCCLTCGADTGPVPDTLGERLVALARLSERRGAILDLRNDDEGWHAIMDGPCFLEGGHHAIDPVAAVAALEAAVAGCAQ